MKESDVLGRTLKACEKVMPGCVPLKHYDLVTSGVPDVSLTWAERTVWLEFKLDTLPSPIQIQVMKRLGQQGIAYYVVFHSQWQMPSFPWVQIWDHTQMGIWSCPKFNYREVAEFIRQQIESRNNATRA